MMPVLAIIANLVGWFGGAIVCKYTHLIGIEPVAYFATMRRYMDFDDIINGLVKAEVFGCRRGPGLLRHRAQHPRRSARDRRRRNARRGRPRSS
jgi:hypothetical protein